VARVRHLRNAPLREALIDIQFDPVGLDAIDRFVNTSSGYRFQTDLWQAHFELRFDESQLSTVRAIPAGHHTQSAVGRRLESADGRPFVLQCRVSGFTLSRLSPYGEWAELHAEARRLWELFISQVGAVSVTRIAVRYINEIRLPVPVHDFEEYFVCPPRVPPTVPQIVSAFLSRVVMPDQRQNFTSIVTQATEGSAEERPTDLSVILDIDIFRTGRYAGNSVEIWDGLGALRDQKNLMFFEHLTEKTVEMYE
jgi:uncharacterized protein (TIGR04255 family)